MPEDGVPRNYATYQDLNSLRAELHQELAAFRSDFKSFQSDVLQQLSLVGKTNWPVVISSVGLVVTLAGLAAALIGTQIQAEAEARIASDDAHIRTMTEIIRRLDGNITENRVDLANIDSTLQREMRLLDQTLQRELNLHVDRLENLVNVNKQELWERRRLEDGK